MGTLVTVTAATALPVTLEDAKIHCRITEDDTTHDVRLLQLIADATSHVESVTGTRLCSQTVCLYLDGFPDGNIDLSVYPVASITNVKYDDTSNTEQTLALTTDYWQDLNGMYPMLAPVTCWPVAYCGKPGSVRITMVVGYTSIEDIAPDLRHAILVHLYDLWVTLGNLSAGITVSDTGLLRQIVGQHRRVRL